jgi:hypothetical protein
MLLDRCAGDHSQPPRETSIKAIPFSITQSCKSVLMVFDLLDLVNIQDIQFRYYPHDICQTSCDI